MVKRLVIALLLVLSIHVLSAQENVYQSPDGLWSVTLPNEWIAEENDGYISLKSPNDELVMHVLSVETDNLEQSVIDGWAIVDPDLDTTYTEDDVQRVENPALLDGYEAGLNIFFEDGTGDEGRLTLGSASLYQGISYVLLIDTNITSIQRRTAQLQLVATSFLPTAKAKTTLEASAIRQWDDSMTESLEAFIAESLVGLEVAGASIAIVQGGNIVYANGFGVRDESGLPVTADTRMMIGSTSKSMTTLLMAQAVDAGVMAWDTPVVSLFPSFAVKDPQITEQITVENLVCACTGVPRRDLEFIFNDIDAQEVFNSLQSFEFYTQFGEAFQYSNQMVAAGGYVASVALSPEADDLYSNYVALMEANIFEPSGMANTTFDFEEIATSDDYALPYGATLDGYQMMPLESEKWVAGIAPSGGVWSTANDMARYALLQLNGGIAEDGTRIVSEENLRHTQAPQIEMSANTFYGLGWIVTEYKGIPMIEHGGNTFGFSSDFAFLPENEIGIVVLVNQRASAFPALVRQATLELFFGEEESQAQQVLDLAIEEAEKAKAEPFPTYDWVITEEDTFTSFVGTYQSPTLGEVTLSRDEDGTAWFDAGEFVSKVAKRTDEDGTVTFVLAEPPVPGIEVALSDTDGVKTFSIGAGLDEAIFTQSN